MRHFDLIVIGAGPGGYAAAVRGWDHGKRVALIERDRVGGAGLHNGVLASKTLWELSRDYRSAKRTDRGFDPGPVHVSLDQVQDVVREAISERQGQLCHQLDVLATPGPNHPGTITRVHGTARFVDPHTVTVTHAGDVEHLTADTFILATGSRPRTLPGVEFDGQRVMTSDHVLTLETFPRSLVIVGGGVIGCEFATIFANYGHTKVYVIDRASRILPFEDEDVAHVCASNLEAKGVTIHRKASLISLEVRNEQVFYTIEHATGGRETIAVERALVAIGRVPNTDNLGLENAGVTLTERGHVVVDATESTVKHIHAVGDITYDLALASVAELEGRHAVDALFAGRHEPLPIASVPTILFLDPEVSAVGHNEQTAQKARIPYRVATYSYRLVNRTIAMRATQGFVKVLVTDDDDLKVVGMRALGAHASTTIESIAILMRQGVSVRHLAEAPHAHPAVTEGLQECVRMFLGTSVMKPNVFATSLRLSRVGYAPDPVETVLAPSPKALAASQGDQVKG